MKTSFEADIITHSVIAFIGIGLLGTSLKMLMHGDQVGNALGGTIISGFFILMVLYPLNSTKCGLDNRIIAYTTCTLVLGIVLNAISFEVKQTETYRNYAPASNLVGQNYRDCIRECV